MPNFRNLARRANARRSAPSNRRRRGGRTRMMEPVLSEKNLGTVRLPGVDQPPTHISNPQITRTVRITTAYSGTAINSQYSAKTVANQDALDYLGSTTNLRYGHLRILKAEVWLGLQTFGSGLPSLVVYDPYSEVHHNDVAAVGVDFAHVAIRPCLALRSNNFGTSDDTNAILGVNVPASEGAVGTLTVDLTVTFE